MKVSRQKIQYMDLKVLIISADKQPFTTPKLLIWELNGYLRCKSIPAEISLEEIENFIIQQEENSD